LLYLCLNCRALVTIANDREPSVTMACGDSGKGRDRIVMPLKSVDPRNDTDECGIRRHSEFVSHVLPRLRTGKWLNGHRIQHCRHAMG